MQATFLAGEAPNAARRQHSDRLFIPKLLERAGSSRQLDGPALDDAHGIIRKWADLEQSGRLVRMNESQLRGEFFQDVFTRALHYTRFSDNQELWQLWQEFPVNGHSADAAVGEFRHGQAPNPVAIVELKGPKTNVDRDRSQGRTAVEQCWDYLNDLPGCQWGIVSNIISFRLYHHRRPRREFEHFSLRELRDDLDRFRQFYALFERGGLLPSIVGHRPRAEQLLLATSKAQKEVSDDLYKLYSENRLQLVRHLIHAKRMPVDAAIQAAQKLLDRILFIAFCEDRDLLPDGVIKEAWERYSPFEKATNPRWRNFLKLFQSVDQGNLDANIARFNGRLFARDPILDDPDLLDDRWTDFFKDVAGFDFQEEVHLEVLGHVFERSITDLEVLRATPGLVTGEEAPSPGRRKREGVYYTPQHITRFIVENTLGVVIDDAFAAKEREFNIADPEAPDPKRLADWIRFQKARLDVLRSLRVVDPACGSGAFLIQAYEFLEEKYEQVLGALHLQEPDNDRTLRERIRTDILSRNLFGVDISEETVEITRLALWIRTAERGKTLADLSRNILRANSLVDDATVDALAFEWNAAFSEVFAEGGFHCVIGNPPYVKLQNFRRRQPEVAKWLTQRYKAASTGNFDMYLPFIERGLELLRPNGRLGFIAPSVWLFNEYGRGLRELIAESRSLAQFIDFKSHQVFEDATTYTALQFFSKSPREEISVADASSGNLEQLVPFTVTYQGKSGEAWALLDQRSQAILDRMREGSVRLDEASGGIIVGIQTSADAVYHLIKVRDGEYWSSALSRVVEIEDDVMKPLVSGVDAYPFALPPPNKFLLFPYALAGGKARLLSEREMKRHKRAWHYLKQNEAALRNRESGKMDRDGWYGYNYPKNLEKQDKPKLLVPRLLLHLFCAADLEGELCIDNVDVGGVLCNGAWQLEFLLALLNSKAIDYFWRATSKPFRGGYRSANKQFIAPLPIPADKDQKPLASLAKKLTKLHAERHQAVGTVHRRFVTDLPPKVLIETSPLPPKLPGRLARFEELSMSSLLAAMEEYAERAMVMDERDRWHDYLLPQISAIHKLDRRIADLQEQLDREAYALYALDGESINAIERTGAKRGVNET